MPSKPSLPNEQPRDGSSPYEACCPPDLRRNEGLAEEEALEEPSAAQLRLDATPPPPSEPELSMENYLKRGSWRVSWANLRPDDFNVVEVPKWVASRKDLFLFQIAFSPPPGALLRQSDSARPQLRVYFAAAGDSKRRALDASLTEEGALSFNVASEGISGRCLSCATSSLSLSEVFQNASAISSLSVEVKLRPPCEAPDGAEATVWVGSASVPKLALKERQRPPDVHVSFSSLQLQSDDDSGGEAVARPATVHASATRRGGSASLPRTPEPERKVRSATGTRVSARGQWNSSFVEQHLMLKQREKKKEAKESPPPSGSRMQPALKGGRKSRPASGFIRCVQIENGAQMVSPPPLFTYDASRLSSRSPSPTS
jgi:hypothetical protein